MISYRDKTYCPFYLECAEVGCDRALTETVKVLARNYGLPICQFMDKPECYKGESK